MSPAQYRFLVRRIAPLAGSLLLALLVGLWLIHWGGQRWPNFDGAIAWSIGIFLVEWAVICLAFPVIVYVKFVRHFRR